MSAKNSLLLFITLLVSFTLAACGHVSANSAPRVTDYSLAAHWLSLPAAVKNIDVFYLYPTSYQKINPTDPNICEIDNASMLKGSIAAFGRQATAFETVGNIFAPYYRQADAAYTLSLPQEQRDIVVGGIPTLDAVAAFDYYIKHYNNGRSFILAGHSQGSNVLLFLLSGYMKENPSVYARMIAAYVIGYSVTDDYLAECPHLKFAEGPDDTGVIISYNTESPDVVKGGNPVVLDGALVINPITWTREETLAPVSEGLGSFMPDASGVFTKVPQYADAQIDKTKGVLVCSTADVNKYSPGPTPQHPIAFPRGVFHTFDYPFYYFNLRANAQNRADKFSGNE
ncbi:MAG: DUF3089 domain-containing protein [bacterium]